jgi:hypothetical protein
MLIETRAISPITDRAVQIRPSRSKDRFVHYKQRGQYRRIHKQTKSTAFDGIHSFEKEEPTYDGQCRTILFHLGHIGRYIDMYV